MTLSVLGLYLLSCLVLCSLMGTAIHKGKTAGMTGLQLAEFQKAEDDEQMEALSKLNKGK